MRAMNRLSARAVATLGPGKYADGAGLWLIKRDDGGAQWVLRYTMHGRRREMGMGNLAQVSLKEARESADRWRGIVRAGKDPIRERERERREAARNIHLLKDIAQDAFEARKSKQAALPFAAQLDAAAEQARYAKERADNMELKNKQLRRELVSADEVDKVWAGEWRDLRSAILAAPTRIRQNLPHLAREDVDEINTILRAILREFANG